MRTRYGVPVSVCQSNGLTEAAWTRTSSSSSAGTGFSTSGAPAPPAPRTARGRTPASLRELAVLERVQPNREGHDQATVDVADLGPQLEQVAVAPLPEHALVAPHLLVAAAEDEVERQPTQ